MEGYFIVLNYFTSLFIVDKYLNCFVTKYISLHVSA